MSDDDDYLNNVSSPQFGEISLTLYELRIHSRGDKTDPPPCPQIAGLAAGEAKIYERSKKSGAHRIRYDYAIPLQAFLGLGLSPGFQCRQA